MMQNKSLLLEAKKKALPPARRGEQQLAKRFRRKRKLPEYLEFGEVQVLLKMAPSPLAALLMLLQWRAGLRISEALALQVPDLQLDGDRPTLRVRCGKGGKERLVPIHPELNAALRTAIAFGGVKKGRIFSISRSTAWRWIKKAYQRAVELGAIAPGRKITTHTLRHSAARHWLASGIPINRVSVWLGHSRLETTLVYLEILPDPLGDIARVP